MERWTDIKGIPGYEVSNFGNVRCKRNGRLLAQHLNRPGGYKRVTIEGKHYCVHRLVADSFFDGDYAGYDVKHKDGDRNNNHIANLSFGSRRRARIVRCADCIHRGEYAFCEGSNDDFYCGYGER